MVVRRFPIRRSRWALPFLLPLSAGRPYAEIGEGEVRVRMGLLGKADLPVERISNEGSGMRLRSREVAGGDRAIVNAAIINIERTPW